MTLRNLTPVLVVALTIAAVAAVLLLTGLATWSLDPSTLSR